MDSRNCPPPGGTSCKTQVPGSEPSSRRGMYMLRLAKFGPTISSAEHVQRSIFDDLYHPHIRWFLDLLYKS